MNDEQAAALRERHGSIYAIFDSERFYADLDQVRRKREVSWNILADITGVMALRQNATHAPNPQINTLVPAAIWAGLSLDHYIRRFDQAGEEFAALRQPDHRPLGYNVTRFYVDLDQVRQQRGMSWPEVRREVRGATLPLGLGTFIAQYIPLDRRLCEALATWARLEFSAYLPTRRLKDEIHDQL